jgi:membrane-associated phospholipid phosphatase
MENVWPIEIAIIHFFQTQLSFLIQPMSWITNLGSEQFFILVLPVILWCIDYGLGLRVGFILISSGQIFCVLKMALHSPRPFWYSNQIQAYSVETGFGMPSGHAMNTISIFGLLASEIKRKWVTVTCVLVILLVGLSRMFLGMHFISDVLGGWLLGLGLFYLFVRWTGPFTRWFLRQSQAAQYGLAVASAILWMGLCNLPLIFSTAWTMPVNWLQNALRFGEAARPNPFDPTTIYTGVGIWLGLALGAIWLHGRGGYDARGEGLQQLLRFVIGLVGTGILWFGLDRVFPDGVSFVALAFRTLRYSLVGFWMSGLAPGLFIRLKLARGLR